MPSRAGFAFDEVGVPLLSEPSRERKGEEAMVVVIPVVQFSDLALAGSKDDKTAPENQTPARILSPSDFCSGSSLFSSLISALVRQTDMAERNARLDSPVKMALVVSWSNHSQEEQITDDESGRLTLSEDARKRDAEVQLFEMYCQSYLPWPPLAPSEMENEEFTTPFRPYDGRCLMNELE